MHVAICMQSWFLGHACMVCDVWTIVRYMPSVSRRTFHIHTCFQVCPFKSPVKYWMKPCTNIMLLHFICLNDVVNVYVYVI